jgi:hypothetical protein
MQATVFAPVAASTATASINLENKGYPVNVLTTGALAPKNTPFDELKTLETARISWETTELAASNNRLYSILKQAYCFYLVMKTDESKDVRKERTDALDKFIEERKYTFMPSTHDMTRVVKCVFGVDRRRVSAYSIALREALRQTIDADDLIMFIEENGGVEQIRMGGTKPLSATQRANRVKTEVLNSNVGTFKVDATMSGANADWVDKQVIIVATYLPTGEFVANAVIKHDSAVNAALAAHYTNQQAALRAQVKAEKDAEKQAAAAIKAAEDAAAAKAKADADAKQVEKVKVQQAAAARDAANLAHTNSLLEEALA